MAPTRANEIKWQQYFEKLDSYKRRHGHFPPRSDKLAHWMNDQRRACREGKLSEARQRHLDSIVGFKWEPREAVWERRFRELVAYKRSHGHCNVLKSQHPQLGSWAKKQRANKVNGTLTKERWERLNEIAFEWQLGRGRAVPKMSAENQEEEREGETEGRKRNHSTSPSLATHEAKGNDLEELRKLLAETRKELSETKQEMGDLKSANAATERQLKETQTKQKAMRKDLSETKQQMADLKSANAANTRQLKETETEQKARKQEDSETEQQLSDLETANTDTDRQLKEIVIV